MERKDRLTDRRLKRAKGEEQSLREIEWICGSDKIDGWSGMKKKQTIRGRKKIEILTDNILDGGSKIQK